jgi:PAS domain S-box-containing protein
MLCDSTAAAPDSAKQIFEQLYDPALLIDPAEGRFIGVNQPACDFLGYDASEFQGMTPADVHPHEIPRLDAFLEAVTRNTRWSTDELSCRAKHGGLIPAQVRASLVTLEGRTYVLAIIRDRREEQLAELGRSIRKLTHDLRNTMLASRLMGSRLKSHEDPMVQRSAELISRSVDRAVRMCEEALSAGTSTERAPQRERFPLDDVIDEIVAAISPTDVAGVALERHGSEGVNLDADFDQIFRIILNLVRNALAAGAQRIVIDAACEDGRTHIDIVDDGPGLPEGIRCELFSEKMGRTASQGTGLGLAIAWELASNHGGHIDLLRTGDDGTVFRLVLPNPPNSAAS